jgi:hypothetical protein
MAYPNLVLVDVLRQTAKNLKEGAHYAWGNHGACNCGNLLQVVANVSKEEILTYAHTGFGEWTELAEEYCPVSNTPVNLMIKKLTDIGLRLQILSTFRFKFIYFSFCRHFRRILPE